VNRFYQFKGKYIITTVKSGVNGKDHERAHERILYEQYESGMLADVNIKQRELFSASH
jgi:DNA mismatch repair protein MutL